MSGGKTERAGRPPVLFRPRKIHPRRCVSRRFRHLGRRGPLFHRQRLCQASAHGGFGWRRFRSRNLVYDSPDAIALRAFNVKVMKALRMKRGVTHAEYIKDAEGNFYFLETAARVGGANLAEMIEAASGLNLWREWARVEVANARNKNIHYRRSNKVRGHYGVSCPTRMADMSAYNDPEIVWKLVKEHHAGLIVQSPTPERVQQLLDQYGERFSYHFMAFMPRSQTKRLSRNKKVCNKKEGALPAFFIANSPKATLSTAPHPIHDAPTHSARGHPTRP